MKKQNVDNREKLILEHLPQVRLLALKLKKRLPANIDLDDLISAGTVGLLDAVNKFNPKLGHKFKTYAEFRIRGAMIDELRDLDILTRSKRGKLKQEERNRFHSSKEHQQYQGGQGGSEQMGQVISFEDAVKLRNLRTTLNRAQNETYDKIARTNENERIRAAIEQLSDREGKILTLYYFEEQNLQQIGKGLGLCQAGFLNFTWKPSVNWPNG